MDPIVAVLLPALRVLELRHSARHWGRRRGRPLSSQREAHFPVLPRGQLDACCGFGESRCARRKYVAPRGQLDLVSAGFVRPRFIAAAVSNGCRCGVACELDGAVGRSQQYVRARQHHSLARMERSLHALRQMLFPSQFDSVVARLDGAQAERPVRPNRSGVLLIDQNFGAARRAVDFERAELRLWFQVELHAHLRAFLHFDGLRGLVLKSALGHPHRHLPERLNAQLAALGAPAILLVVQKHAHVVLAGRNNQRARIDVRFQERGQHGRGSEALAHVTLIPALAHYDLIHTRPKTRDVRPGPSGIALRLAVDRELPGAPVGLDARPHSEAGHQYHQHVPRVYGASHGRQSRIRHLERERGVPVLPDDFHRVCAHSHLVEHQLTFLQIDRRPIVHHHLALVQIGQQANRLCLRLECQADRRRLPSRHRNGARHGLETVQRRGDPVSARLERQLAVGCAGTLVAAGPRGHPRGPFRNRLHGRTRRSGRNVDLHGRRVVRVALASLMHQQKTEYQGNQQTSHRSDRQRPFPIARRARPCRRPRGRLRRILLGRNERREWHRQRRRCGHHKRFERGGRSRRYGIRERSWQRRRRRRAFLLLEQRAARDQALLDFIAGELHVEIARV